MKKNSNNKHRNQNYLKRTKHKSVYRSKFEDDVITKLKSVINKYKIKFEYEPMKIEYNTPSIYVPDIVLENKIIVEIKGFFTASDRRKHLLIKQQHPELDIRFVFQKPDNKIYKGSNITYADWCEKHGFKWAKQEIPLHWLKEIQARLINDKTTNI